MLTIADLTIAAVAIVHELTLLTDNVEDFPMKELNLDPLPIAQFSKVERAVARLHNKRGFAESRRTLAL